ncbi:5'-methylthioadenosine/S-adenosylhomocysteine nucleosidase [Tropicimonas sp. IMCC34043]|uniref:5'-methylthioadenosine/S-adenosylhomocysteine nucleosidase n=1 Tax=Tropicimonas sp. IMCC34043 TaxID=2248760 RepID=UPI000E2693C3|nr:5'-methylthioadenosine/S-adenosylhomocysteine nucleosidase [Tropicimonas sp. IMCC34043]
MPIVPRTVLIAAVLAALPALAPAEVLDPTPRIAVISAFEPEWTLMKDVLEAPAVQELNGVTFVTGRVEGKEVVLFLSGVSMVNAAMTTQLALDHFMIDGIVFSGIAGGVDPDLNIGDVVVAGQWIEYLEGILARETSPGSFAIPGFLKSDFPNYGMMFTGPVEVASDRPDSPERKYWFAVDPGMLATATEVAASFDLLACNADNDCLSTPPKVVVGGNGVSGMSFLDNADFRSYLSDTFSAEVVDMESAAVAQVAYANQVPFIAFRSLSDLAGGGRGENEMGTFFSLAAANSAALVRAFLAAYEVPTAP